MPPHNILTVKCVFDDKLPFFWAQIVANKASIFATSPAQVALLERCLKALLHCIEDAQQGDAIKKVQMQHCKCGL